MAAYLAASQEGLSSTSEIFVDLKGDRRGLLEDIFSRISP
jgi:hypothetical protein